MDKEIIITGFFKPYESIRFREVPGPTYRNKKLIQITVHGSRVLNHDDSVTIKVEKKILRVALKKLEREGK